MEQGSQAGAGLLQSTVPGLTELSTQLADEMDSGLRSLILNSRGKKKNKTKTKPKTQLQKSNVFFGWCKLS